MVSAWRVADVTISSSLGRQDCCSWLRWRWWRRCWKKCLDESAIRHVVNSSPLTVVEFVAWHNFTPYWFQLRRHLPIYNNLIVSHPAQLRPLFTTFTAHSFTALFCSIFISVGPRYGMQPSVCLTVCSHDEWAIRHFLLAQSRTETLGNFNVPSTACNWCPNSRAERSKFKITRHCFTLLYTFALHCCIEGG